MKSNLTRKLIHLEVNGKPSEPHSIWLVLNQQHIQKHPGPGSENRNLAKNFKKCCNFSISAKSEIESKSAP